MKKMLYDRTYKRHSFVTVLGITALAFFMLVSIAGATPFAYIANNGDNTVSIIDTVTDEVTATVAVGSNPAGVAVSPKGTKAYVAGRSFLDVTDSWEGDTVEIGTVSVLDTATNTVTASVNVGVGPQGVAVSPDGTKVYVTNELEDTVSVIDTATNTVTATVNVGIRPRGIAVTPDGAKVYVMNYGSNEISIIDTANDAVAATVNTENPLGIAISPDGTKVYVTNNGENVSVIDTATNTVTDTVPVGGLLHGVAVSPDGTKVYVTNGWYKGEDGPYYALEIGTVSVIDTATNAVTATVGVGELPEGIAVSPDGTKVYVANFGSANVSVIDTATNTVTASVNVGSMPIGVAVTPTLEPEISTTQVTTSGSASNPHIYVNRIVYEDRRNGKSDIYMYDLSTRQEAQISTSGKAHYPAIYGDNIVWKDDRNGISDIYMYNLSTSQEKQISTSGSVYSGSTLSGPDICNDRIVWQETIETDSGSHRIIMYDLSTQQETQIIEEYLNMPYYGFYGFAIHGDKILYNYFPCDDCTGYINMYDLSTQQITWIADGHTPDIYGDRIVWEEALMVGDPFEENYYYYDIYMYNLSTQQKIQVSTSGRAHNPAIHNNRIVWIDYCNAYKKPDIYMYDLSTSKEIRITASGSVYSPDIYGDRIVWVDGNDIYAGTLKTPVPVFPGYTNPPKDPDQDGLYEDINGNGILDFDDVVAYYDNMEWIEENAPVACFDYNRNGLIDFDDVVKLYDML